MCLCWGGGRGGVFFMVVWRRTIILLIRCGCVCSSTANPDICPRWWTSREAFCKAAAFNTRQSPCIRHSVCLRCLFRGWCTHLRSGRRWVFKLRLKKSTQEIFKSAARSQTVRNENIFSFKSSCFLIQSVLTFSNCKIWSIKLHL